MENRENREKQALGMLPGGGFVNFLHGQVAPAAQAARPRTLTPPQRQAQQLRTQQMRRARVANRLQSDAQQAGRAPLSENELNTILAEYGL